MRLQTCLAAVSRLSSMQRVCPALLAKMCSIAGEPRRTSRDAKRWQSCFNMRFSAYIQLSLAPGGKAVRKHMQPGCLLHSSRVPRIDVHQNKPVMVRLNSGVVGSSRRICIHSRPVSQLPAPTMHRAPMGVQNTLTSVARQSIHTMRCLRRMIMHASAAGACSARCAVVRVGGTLKSE